MSEAYTEIEVRQLGWRPHRTERFVWVSVPEAFTVSRVLVPIGGQLTAMWQAFDCRVRPARPLYDENDNPCIYPWRDQAQAAAAAAYAKEAEA